MKTAIVTKWYVKYTTPSQATTGRPYCEEGKSTEAKAVARAEKLATIAGFKVLGIEKREVEVGYW